MKRLSASIVLAAVVVAGFVFSARQRLLIHAAARGNTAILRGLLAIGADPNPNGVRPLYAAVWYQQHETAAELIAHGADVNAAERSGVTPLITAASRGDDAMVRLLLSHGASTRAAAVACGSPLDIARANHHKSTASILEAAGALSAQDLR
jgi:ankyrin repeat protein